MEDNDIEQIRKLASEFRKAIIKSNPRSLSIGMQGFPAGACGPSSELLKHYFIENGYSKAEYFTGSRLEKGQYNNTVSQSHAWVQLGRFIIDITADQFSSEISEPVIVEKDSKWHKQFNGRRSDLELEGELLGDYRKIISNL